MAIQQRRFKAYVKRFNDAYNGAVIGKLGWVGKPFLPTVCFSVSYSNMYKEIQTGVRQEAVFGETPQGDIR